MGYQTCLGETGKVGERAGEVPSGNLTYFIIIHFLFTMIYNYCVADKYFNWRTGDYL